MSTAMSTHPLQSLIDAAFERRADITAGTAQRELLDALDAVILELNAGRLRVAEKIDGAWTTHQWIKKAVLLYFRTHDNAVMPAGGGVGGGAVWFDKVPLRFHGYTDAQFRAGGFRAVPTATVRTGTFIGRNVVLMPSYVNIGAYVDEGTMVDTWATVGSCAQIGKNVHLSGGVGIGGVLEPLQAAPVVIEDNAFIGSRCIVVEGVRVGKEAVLGANVVLTKSTKIIDVTGDQPVEMKGYVPERSVVIPGSYAKQFPAGEFQVPCALIIGKRKASTDLKTSLNDALRENEVAV